MVEWEKFGYETAELCHLDARTSSVFSPAGLYKQFIDNNDNILLKFCKDLALNGPSKKTYLERVNILREIFPEVEGITNIKLIYAECNVSYVISKLLKSAPSSIEVINSHNKYCSISNKHISSPTIIVRFKTDLSGTERKLIEYIKINETDCGQCKEKVVSQRILQNHLFIETDGFIEERQYRLFDIVDRIFINYERYV